MVPLLVLMIKMMLTIWINQLEIARESINHRRIHWQLLLEFFFFSWYLWLAYSLLFVRKHRNCTKKIKLSLIPLQISQKVLPLVIETEKLKILILQSWLKFMTKSIKSRLTLKERLVRQDKVIIPMKIPQSIAKM